MKQLVLPILVVVLSHAAWVVAEQRQDSQAPSDEQTLRKLTLLAKDKDPERALHALKALGRMGEAAVPFLVELLKDDDSGVREVAAVELGKLGAKAKSSVPFLIETLKDKDSIVRGAAAKALGKLGREGKASVPALIDALNDKDWSARWKAASALGDIGPEAKAAVPALASLLKDKEVRPFPAYALASIGPEAKSAIPALVELLKDADASTSDRESAGWAIGKIIPATSLNSRHYCEIKIPKFDASQRKRSEILGSRQRLPWLALRNS